MPAPNPRTGIIDTEIERDPIQDAPAPPVEPKTTQVDVDTETVESRLTNLTASGSPYIRQAETDARREANSRGLINSTIAAGAGREAAIRTALPIAQQDARTFTDTRLRNQDTSNRFLENRQSANLNKELAAQENELQMRRDTNSSQLNESLATLESSLRESEMTLESQLKTDFETHLNDERFSDEAKLQIVNSMNGIIRDAQAQMVEIGRTDRSAAQQASAIALVQANRDAQIAVYQDILDSFNDWTWSTDFVPSSTPQSVAAAVPPPTKQPPTRSGAFGLGSGSQQSCFIAGTKVICADGSERNIEDIEIGDYIRGMGGEPNEVISYDQPKLGNRLLYSINTGPSFVTAEHPFMTPAGWRSIDPEMTAKENPGLEVGSLVTGDSVELTEGGFMTIDSLIGTESDPETQLYNFKLSGNNTYYANGYLVHNKAGE